MEGLLFAIANGKFQIANLRFVICDSKRSETKRAANKSLSGIFTNEKTLFCFEYPYRAATIVSYKPDVKKKIGE